MKRPRAIPKERLTAEHIRTLGSLDDNSKMLIGAGYCPDCGYRGFVLGPRGGVAINIECGNVDCRSRFNVVSSPFNHAALLYGERIPGEENGGSTWDDGGGLWEGVHR